MSLFSGSPTGVFSPLSGSVSGLTWVLISVWRRKKTFNEGPPRRTENESRREEEGRSLYLGDKRPHVHKETTTNEGTKRLRVGHPRRTLSDVPYVTDSRSYWVHRGKSSAHKLSNQPGHRFTFEERET